MKNNFGQPTADEHFREISDLNAERHFLWKHYVEYENMWPTGLDLFLQRDDLPRFFEWFFNHMVIAVHHDYLVGVEPLDGTPSNAPGESERWRAIRDMFVNERGRVRWIAAIHMVAASDSALLAEARRPSIRERHGYTLWGPVSLDTSVSKDGNSVAVSANLALAVLPTEVRVRLRSGNGRSLTSATVRVPTPQW